MKNEKLKIINILIITTVLVLPSLGFTQGVQAPETIEVPETIEEAKSFGLRILKALPGAAEETWRNEALPFFQGVWKWTKTKIKTLWQKIWSLFVSEVEKRRPAIKEEFKKEKEEMKEEIQKELPKVRKSLWERFKELLK